MYDQGPPFPRATLWFQPRREIALTITVDHVREALWPFAHAPALRVPWRFAGTVKAVRLATVRAFDAPSDDPTQGKRVRVEVDIEGAPAIALEGAGVTIGPVARPVVTPVQPEMKPVGDA